MLTKLCLLTHASINPSYGIKIFIHMLTNVYVEFIHTLQKHTTDRKIHFLAFIEQIIESLLSFNKAVTISRRNPQQHGKTGHIHYAQRSERVVQEEIRKGRDVEFVILKVYKRRPFTIVKCVQESQGYT